MKFNEWIPGRLMRIIGHSMLPLLRPGDLVFISNKAFDIREPRQGEVVAVCPSRLGGKMVVKRLAGLPHQRVQVDGSEWHLGKDEYFLLGDCHDESMDSRTFGPVSFQALIGPVRVRLWPWKFIR